jgi:hypothetical protein
MAAPDQIRRRNGIDTSPGYREVVDEGHFQEALIDPVDSTYLADKRRGRQGVSLWPLNSIIGLPPRGS